MHTPVSALRRIPFICGTLATAATVAAAAQQLTVEGLTRGASVLQEAEALFLRGRHDSATTMLSMHVAGQPTDGRAWFLLGRIYLANAREWHRGGHLTESSGGPVFIDMAGSSFEPASELLTDSGGVFRVVVAMERATLRIETGGWDSLATWRTAAEDLPLPPVLAELGRNLLASCSRNGVVVTGSSVAETAAVWGIWLQGERRDLIVIRPDMYQWDLRYRGRMAAAIGADSTTELGPALASAARNRPVCLGPSVEAISEPGLQWTRSMLVLATVATVAPSNRFSLFRFSQTGLTGSVWTAAARDEYDLAARRNRLVCSTLFATTYVSTPPAISACSQ